MASSTAQQTILDILTASIPVPLLRPAPGDRGICGCCVGGQVGAPAVAAAAASAGLAAEDWAGTQNR